MSVELRQALADTRISVSEAASIVGVSPLVMGRMLKQGLTMRSGHLSAEQWTALLMAITARMRLAGESPDPA